jgi:hypothetical protein
MKRLISLLLAIILLLAAGTALADDWYCPECGEKNSGNFCPNDGTKRPDGAGTDSKKTSTASDLRIDSVKLQYDGSVSVAWSGGTAPYNVYYQYYVNGNYNTGVNDVVLWTAESGTYGNQSKYEGDFVPGEHYWVIVEDANRNEAWYDFNERIGAFSRASCPCYFTLRTHKNNRSSMVKFFSASEIEREYSYNLFGANIKATPKLTQEMTFMFRMAVILPSGEPILFHLNQGTIKPTRGRAYYIWENYDFKNLWNTLMRTKGEIPVGTYTYKLFIDNEYAFTQDFQMER